jgi:hypothetical protein
MDVTVNFLVQMQGNFLPILKKELKKTFLREEDLNSVINLSKTKGGVFEFASSNSLWRASLDVIDFMPLSSVNYSGGIIITDWYSENNNPNESIKISIRFMTNEIRSDALNIKVFNRKCLESLLNCKITETDGVLVTELKREILKQAVMYKKMSEDKKSNEPYKYPKMKKKN